MNKIKSLVFIFLLLPVFALAQENSDAKIEEPDIEIKTIEFSTYAEDYTEELKINDNTTNYYYNDTLVLSTIDSNEDAKADMWLRYDKNNYLDLELLDLDFDGEIDIINQIDREENSTPLKQADFELSETKITKDPNQKQAEPKIDNSEKVERFMLNSPPAENTKSGFPFKWIIILASVAILLYFFKKKQASLNSISK